MPHLQYSSTCQLIFFVNGNKVVDDSVDPECTLLHYLRTKLRLSGTKLGCGEGACGACTVMVSKINRCSGQLIHYAVNACIAPVCAMHGLAVTTVEGIGSARGSPHAVQERLARTHGSQCGFCTPGIVMSMYALLRSTPKPNREQVDIAFQGNLCRCTGYRPILEGFSSFVEDWEVKRAVQNESNNASCCKNGNVEKQCCMKSQNGCCMETREITDKLTNVSEFSPYDGSSEPIFPPELSVSDKLDIESVVFRGERVTWYRPTNLEKLLELKSQYPAARLVVGNTEVGLEMKFKNCLYPVIIQPSNIQELTQINVKTEGVQIGAAVTLTEVEEFLLSQIKTLGNSKTKVFTAIVEMFQYFAGKQVRNVACLGGNIMTGSPISDINPILMAAGCVLQVRSKNATRYVKMDHKFFTSYRKNIILPEELVISITIPYTAENVYFIAYKQAKRRDDDIAIVNAAFNLELKGDLIHDISMAFGGMAATTVMATKTAEKLKGREWNEETLTFAMDSLLEELTLDPGAPGGMVTFRRSLTLGFWMKFYLAIQTQRLETVRPVDVDAPRQFHTIPARGSQYFEMVPRDQGLHDLVGRPIPHQSALKQATGEAVYCDDMPQLPGELQMALVYSNRAHARIVEIDASSALSLPGVVAFFSAKDVVPEKNKFGIVVQDEQIFYSDKVTSHGQVLGALLAENRDLARRAAKLVQVQYEDLQPVVITIEDAITAKSFYDVPNMQFGAESVSSVLDSCDHVVQGEVHLGGQEHFYLETQSCLIVPGKEDNELEVFCAAQAPTTIQNAVAHFLGLPENRVVVRVKRLGGGFGGKETRTPVVILPAVLAAFKLQRPVRCMLDRDDDMLITGGRNPFLGRYKVGFSSSGIITACDMDFFNNAGSSLDFSGAVMNRAMNHVNNAYSIPHVSTRGHICKTNLPSNTAFRGFGSPQAMFIAENYIEDIASILGKDPAQIRETNLQEDGYLMHYKQVMENCTVRRCWQECISKSNYWQRKSDVDKFNKENRWKKRGISIVPTTYGIAFDVLHLNQAGALVHVYTDGSVLVTHGGVEMGQGLHTKMIQVASRALDVPEVDIHISETSTDKVPNSVATAASTGSDLNGMAVLDACTTLMKRLEPFRTEDPKGGWKAWVKAAYLNRVSLSATGFHATPDVGFDWVNRTGKMYNYYTYGAACSEVQIDCLTGDHQVLRTDIVMDLGESINPAIDIGQIEGGFMQGYGLFTLEELLYSPTGALLTRGPSTYKIPGFGDVPAEFNVSLLRGAPNPRAVYSSKAVGEPPLFLAASVFFAIKGAISSARADAGITGPFRLDAPATAERIRLGCADHITAKIVEPTKGSFTPWNVVP